MPIDGRNTSRARWFCCTTRAAGLAALLVVACGQAFPQTPPKRASTARTVTLTSPAVASKPASSSIPSAVRGDPTTSSSADTSALSGGTATGIVHDLVVSRQLLESHRLHVGDTVQFSADPTGANPRAFRIAGVYEPLANPIKLTDARWEAKMHLPDLLAMTADPSDPFSSESVNTVNVALANPADDAAFSYDLSARMPGVWAVPTRKPSDGVELFAVLERFHLAIALVTVLGSTAFLMALMVMRADERRETVGILRLLGVSRGRILAEVLIEGLLIAAGGAVFGVVFAAATEGAVNHFFQWHYNTSLVFLRVTPGIAAKCVALAVPLGMMAGLVASWTILRRSIVRLVLR